MTVLSARAEVRTAALAAELLQLGVSGGLYLGILELSSFGELSCESKVSLFISFSLFVCDSLFMAFWETRCFLFCSFPLPSYWWQQGLWAKQLQQFVLVMGYCSEVVKVWVNLGWRCFHKLCWSVLYFVTFHFLVFFIGERDPELVVAMFPIPYFYQPRIC